jgi:tryptophan-rich sensory protein
VSTTTEAIVYSVAVCALGALLEGAFAGSGVRQRLASLRLPSYAVPFWGWMVIGALYYVICFVVLYRLFLLPTSRGRAAAFGLIGALMFINAFWNYFFFRTRNLFHAYLLGLPYGAVAISLFLLLVLRLDAVAAWSFCPYLLYLFYATVWGYRTWKLNSLASS